MKLMKMTVMFLAVALIAMPMFAQKLSGPHYNLNIIGVEKGKTADMQDSSRHSIFVALGSSGTSVQSNIYLVPGDFQVCDGNGFDAAVDCQGNSKGTGAVFQLPCNTNVPADITCEAGTASAAYEVWARALGKPGGSATMTTCATDLATLELLCSTENVMLVRSRGKSKWDDVTNELTSLLADIDGDGILERVALFAGGFEDWYWAYANKGLRLAQLRFYLL